MNFVKAISDNKQEEIMHQHLHVESGESDFEALQKSNLTSHVKSVHTCGNTISIEDANITSVQSGPKPR